MLRFLLTILLALFACPASAVEVVGDDVADVYVISGATILNDTTPAAREAVDCTDCHWRIVRICASGTLDDRRGCDQLGITCEAAFAEVWRADATALPPIGDPSWQYRGLMCLSGPPVPASSVRTAIPDLVRQAVPPLRPGAAPGPATVTNLRTAFFAGQAASNPAAVDVAGVRVQLHLRPRWTWDFGHGTPLSTTHAGSASIASPVAHVYRRRGIYRVTVVTTWTATYDANGITGLTVDDNVQQSGSFDIRVKEARRYSITTRSTR